MQVDNAAVGKAGIVCLLFLKWLVPMTLPPPMSSAQHCGVAFRIAYKGNAFGASKASTTIAPHTLVCYSNL
jgi:hypothetical protein